jgi:lysozyme family protein
MKLTEKLKIDYCRLWNSCIVKPNLLPIINKKIIEIQSNFKIYNDISLATGGIPWHFIALLHLMESNNDFTKHLHNGDPLSARTKQEPKGRPIEGKAPFTFEESAIDALEYEKLDQWEDWSIPGILFQIEAYNGFGYRKYHPECLTPYLWAGTNHYTKGKYIEDGIWKANAISQQIGIACYLRRF